MSIIESGRLANASVSRDKIPVIIGRVNTRPPESALVRVGSNGSVYGYVSTIPTQAGQLLIYEDLNFPGIPELLCSVEKSDGSFEYVSVLMGSGLADAVSGGDYDPFANS